MATRDRDRMQKPEFLDDAAWEMLKDQTSSLERIKRDARADVEAYLANPAGRATGAGPSGLPTLLLTTIGRRSGAPRTMPLVFLQHGEDVVVVASLAGYDSQPAWYRNLQANPECWIQLDERRMRARAREADAPERKTLWPRLVAMFPLWGHFQQQTERPFPIVIVSPTGPA
jgi:deazaflavin-dependent oxidoreductase (nitroreductase family)